MEGGSSLCRPQRVRRIHISRICQVFRILVDARVRCTFLSIHCRVESETTLIDLRAEIANQLELASLPETYIFLRSIGRCFTWVRRKSRFPRKKDLLLVFTNNEFLHVHSAACFVWAHTYIKQYRCTCYVIFVESSATSFHIILYIRVHIHVYDHTKNRWLLY